MLPTLIDRWHAGFTAKREADRRLLRPRTRTHRPPFVFPPINAVTIVAIASGCSSTMRCPAPGTDSTATPRWREAGEASWDGDRKTSCSPVATVFATRRDRASVPSGRGAGAKLERQDRARRVIQETSSADGCRAAPCICRSSAALRASVGRASQGKVAARTRPVTLTRVRPAGETSTRPMSCGTSQANAMPPPSEWPTTTVGPGLISSSTSWSHCPYRISRCCRGRSAVLSPG